MRNVNATEELVKVSFEAQRQSYHVKVFLQVVLSKIEKKEKQYFKLLTLDPKTLFSHLKGMLDLVLIS